jgi:hypothetical protein
MFACLNNKIRLYRFSLEVEGNTYKFFSQEEVDKFRSAKNIPSDIQTISLDTTSEEWLEGIECKNYTEAKEIYEKGVKPISVEEHITNIELALVELYEGGLTVG